MIHTGIDRAFQTEHVKVIRMSENAKDRGY